MLSNSSLQPWFDYDHAINHASLVDNPFAALPPVQPCYGGSIGGEAVNCSVVCEYSYLLFDPQHPSNLVTCGLWATLTAGFERSGSYPNATPFDAVGLNISATESIGGGVCSFSGPNLSFSGPRHGLRDLLQEQKTLSTPSSCFIAQNFASKNKKSNADSGFLIGGRRPPPQRCPTPRQFGRLFCLFLRRDSLSYR